MAESKKPSEQDVFVSAILAKTIDGLDVVDGEDPSLTLREVKPNLINPVPGYPNIVRLTAVLYFTVFFRNPRAGTHPVKVVLRDSSWATRMEINFTPREHAKTPRTQAMFEAIDITFPLGEHFLCVQVDDVDRAVIPLTVKVRRVSD